MRRSTKRGQTDLIIRALKRLLRDHGLRYSDVAIRLQVSETTVKRWFSGKSMSIGLVEELCGILDIGVAELVEFANRDHDPRLRCLREEQEKALSEDRHLSYLFYLILQGWTPQELQREYGLPEPALVQYLARLDRLRLIDLLPGNRVKLLTTRTLEWRKGGPMMQGMNRHVKRLFTAVDYLDADVLWQLEIGKLSTASRLQIAEKFRTLKIEIAHLAENDRAVPTAEKEWYGVLMVAAPFEKSEMSGSDPARPRQAAIGA